jgi:hypothetical protein
MASNTEIANLALSHIGVSKEIQNLETDKSNEAQSARRYYDTALDVVLRDFPWPFATRFLVLGKVEDDPTAEWGVSYRYPSDCVIARRILSGIRNENRQSLVPFRVTRDTAGRLIYTDKVDACLEYTIRADDPTLYPPDFTMAFSFRLAFYIAPRLTEGDPFRLQDRMFQLYRQELTRAGANSFNEETSDQQPLSEAERSRNAGDASDFGRTDRGF